MSRAWQEWKMPREVSRGFTLPESPFAKEKAAVVRITREVQQRIFAVRVAKTMR